jgi:hypothetical protein
MAPDDLSPRGDLAAPEYAAEYGAEYAGPRQTLAMRLAERNRQRELRAERLARLRPSTGSGDDAGADPTTDALAGTATGRAMGTGTLPVPVRGAAAVPERAPVSTEAAEAALEDFLRALTGDLPPLPEGPPIEPGELLPFQRPAETASRTPCDLDRLPGIGPGLIWALERTGLRRLADLAPLAPSELAARLGPLGRLVPAERWIATARAAEGWAAG